MLFALSKCHYWHNAQVGMNNKIFSGMSSSNGKKLSSTKTKNNFKAISCMRNKHTKILFQGHLNTSSLGNNFEALSDLFEDI